LTDFNIACMSSFRTLSGIQADPGGFDDSTLALYGGPSSHGYGRHYRKRTLYRGISAGEHAILAGNLSIRVDYNQTLFDLQILAGIGQNGSLPDSQNNLACLCFDFRPIGRINGLCFGPPPSIEPIAASDQMHYVNFSGFSDGILLQFYPSNGDFLQTFP
jgi:hypothetical protein